jgi:hypothetical protein
LAENHIQSIRAAVIKSKDLQIQKGSGVHAIGLVQTSDADETSRMLEYCRLNGWVGAVKTVVDEL